MFQQFLKKTYPHFILFYTLILLYQMTFGFGRAPFEDHLYRIIPIWSSYELVRDATSFYDYCIYFRNLFGNIILFIPFGFLGWALPDKKTLKQILTVFLPAIFLAELLQLITKLGVFDVDDILLNTSGVYFGYLIKKKFFK